jgi:hypothetical protein
LKGWRVQCCCSSASVPGYKMQLSLHSRREGKAEYKQVKVPVKSSLSF